MVSTMEPPSFTVIGMAQTKPFVIIAADPDTPTPQTRYLVSEFFALNPSPPEGIDNQTLVIDATSLQDFNISAHYGSHTPVLCEMSATIARPTPRLGHGSPEASPYKKGVGLVASQDLNLNVVKRAFEDASIPANLAIKFNPSALLEVTFPESTGKDVTLHAGIQLPRNSTAGPPTFSAIGDIGNGPFLIATVDPDAPTPQAPTSAQIRHFLAPNFFANGRPFTPVQSLDNGTAAISEFLQPTPPAGSDAHRYIFLLFKQPRGFNDQTLVTPATPIQLFNISTFAVATGLGDPIAGTFMLVAPDPPVA
ncbi:hypothetical protein DXG01_001435 [Tephrocybe rancida]|nr:hypothetical protein DXG01_001435 [Tephrocybe rancida]